MTQAATLTELIEKNSTVARNITYLNGENAERRVSFGELYQRALGILHHLQGLGARRGDKLILFLADNEQFIDAFWAAVLGGIVPVPVAIGISDEHRHKLLRIARKLGTPYLYTDRRSLERIDAFASQAGEERTMAALKSRVFLVDQLEDISRPGRVHPAQPDDVAFIQFSSGSTSEPKGVILTHRNILVNGLAAHDGIRANEQDVSLSWMPLTHDMGLIGFHIYMFAWCVPNFLMPTDLFVRRPLLWLTFAARLRASILCSPNFGYRHYLKVLGDRPVDELDLSAVRVIFNGAEPISAALCNEFLDRMAAARLKRAAMFPVYGLAEASLAMTFPEVGAPLRTLALDRHHLSVGEQARSIARDTRDAIELVGVGRAVPPGKLRISGDDDQALPQGIVGHIQISGDYVTQGYFEDPAANASAFTADGWLRTGDLGVVQEGDLFITGRAKEILFAGGQNYYPHDLEEVIAKHAGIELGRAAACGARPPSADTDEVLVFVTHRGELREFLPLAKAVRKSVNEHIGVVVDHVMPLTRLPKTTSGKIQRYLLAEAYQKGEFKAVLAEIAALESAASAPAGEAHTDIEKKLKEICDAFITSRPLGIDDNIFELGTSSLTLAQIYQRIEAVYPGQLEVTDFFDYPTIAQLAKYLEQRLAAAHA